MTAAELLLLAVAAGIATWIDRRVIEPRIAAALARRLGCTVEQYRADRARVVRSWPAPLRWFINANHPAHPAPGEPT